MTDLHVATTGHDTADGSAATPFRTVSRAAEVAMPGDTVVVHAGEYREWVRPARGGLSDRRRITYTAAPGERVVLKGSERVTGWRHEGGGVWVVVLPHAFFGGWNPFAHEVAGDWLLPPASGHRVHLGQVYLDGRSLYEVADAAAVRDPDLPTQVPDAWTGLPQARPDAAAVRRVFHVEVGEEGTTLRAHLGTADPAEHLVEVTVRRSVFFPTRHHLDWITVRGFEMAHAATPWAPPTADQPGMVGPNWAKGWVIEDNHLHDATCAAISLGKEPSTGDGWSTERGDKPGYLYQLESVFAAHRMGWDREHVGSHVVRRNHVHDCGQNGIVGHLGAAFSTIEDNHVHDIGTKREFVGYEIAGIKLHAAIDVVLRHNRVHDSTLGIWLDWQTQGTRVTRNLLYANTRDLFVEVSHGPYVVDHNVLASPAALEVFSQGGAFVHNLVAGAVRLETVPDRATPYHLPHSTQVAGYAVIDGGDDRLLGNLFVGGDPSRAYAPGRSGPGVVAAGTAGYDGYPPSVEAWRATLGEGDHLRFRGRRQAVHVRRNAYAGGAAPYEHEDDPVLLTGPASVAVVDEGEQVHLELVLPARAADPVLAPVRGEDLPHVRVAAAEFDDRDAGPLLLDEDLVGHRKRPGAAYPAGPLAELPDGPPDGPVRLRVW